MAKCIEIDKQLSVSEQITVSDLQALKDQGFDLIICNRPDFEEANQVQADDIKNRAIELGLKFLHIPVSKSGPTMQAIEMTKQTFDEAGGPIFAYCRSGQRSVMMWSLATALGGGATADEILSTASAAGFKIDGLRATLESLSS